MLKVFVSGRNVVEMGRARIAVSDLLNEEDGDDAGLEPDCSFDIGGAKGDFPEQHEVARGDSLERKNLGAPKIRKRKRWTAEEDVLLRSLVEKHGPLRWNVIAENFDGRDGQHLRLRWMNHLRPSLDKKPWTPKEDETILRLQRLYGNSWVRIANSLPGRSDNAIKNRFYLLKKYQEQASASSRSRS
uniref:Uncharacterized protein n=1 Tax=Rhodosorus marinus TaxID=101924 RepID=A0A7S3EFQ1_9RHOD|mmetsp:Transcript_30609/g.117043  ORF Transcript_30609/g.117043 Transcript_30609/m.117043 type:complete len:187 (+) Transcript_30609:653-1213(+)